MTYLQKILAPLGALLLMGIACPPIYFPPPPPNPCSTPFSTEQAIFLQYPKEWQVFQMDANNYSGSIPVKGMYKEEYTGGVIPTGIEAQWGDFSPWVLVDANPNTTARTFQGTMPDQDALLGRQAFRVRFANAPEITFSVGNVGVGIVVVGEGQSNLVQLMVGAFRSLHGASRAWLLTDPMDPHAIAPAIDPLNGCFFSGMGGGSMNPELLDRLSLANGGVPVMYIGAGVSGSNMGQWQPGNADVWKPVTDNLRMATANGASCPAVRYRLQGESEMRWTSQEGYESLYLSYEDAIQNFFVNELGCPAPVPVVLGVIGPLENTGTGWTFEDVEPIRAAQRALVGMRPQIFAGPETMLCPMTNGIHFNTDAKQCLMDAFCASINAASSSTGVACQ